MSLNILLPADVHASATPIRSALPAAEVVRLKHAPGAEELKRLLAVGAHCTGTNNIELQAAAARGAAVFNGPFSKTRVRQGRQIHASRD